MMKSPIHDPRARALVVALATLAIACGGAPPPVPSTGPTARDIAGARALQGPFASWAEVCGEPAVPEPGAEPVPDDPAEHHARCSVEVVPLSSGGPFEAMATYYEGSRFQGVSYLALRTDRGWFVTEMPDGRGLGGAHGHHEPSSLTFDAGSSRFEDGALRVVARGSSSVFLPGRGGAGSSSTQWTSVQQCGLRDGVVVCSAPDEVYRRSCHTPEDGDDGASETCETQGEDVPQPT